MSSHFNYEIDELRLRDRLREMNYPLRDEAWHKFDSFYESQKISLRSRTAPSLQLNINRDFFVVGMFGLGILLLSFILFRFIHISDAPEIKTTGETISTEVRVADNKTFTAPEAPTKQEVRKDSPTGVTESLNTDPTISASNINSFAAKTSTADASKVNATATRSTSVADGSSVLFNMYCFSETDVYESPNIASRKIGKVAGGKSYPVYEETNYYIKTVFDTKGNTGYVLKSFMNKSGTKTQPIKKERKVEEMETNSVNNNTATPAGQEKDPELK